MLKISRESEINLVNVLMGKKPELRFKFIQENASKVNEFDI